MQTARTDDATALFPRCCRGGWRVWGDHGSGLVSKCRNGFNVKLNRQGVTVVRVHTPEELREEMRRVFTLATGLAA